MADGQRLFYGKLKGMCAICENSHITYETKQQNIVSTHVFGYYKLDKRNQILDTVDVYMDPIIRTTNGVWVDVPANALRALGELELDMNASVHAAGIYLEIQTAKLKTAYTNTTFSSFSIIPDTYFRLLQCRRRENRM